MTDHGSYKNRSSDHEMFVHHVFSLQTSLFATGSSRDEELKFILSNGSITFRERFHNKNQS